MENILFARKGTMLNDPIIGRRITRRGPLASRQLLADVRPEGRADCQEFAPAFDIALV